MDGGGMKVRPGYKQTEVGIIPEDWDVKKIDEIGRVTSGKRLPLGSSLVEHPTPHPYIRVTDMRPGTVSLSDIKFVPESVFQAIKRYRIFRDDIFISVAGTLGIVGKVTPELDGANLTENADRITDIRCSRDFLLYVLMSPLIQNAIDSIRTVGAQPKLALTRIRQFTIPLPPSEAAQRAIATALSNVDALLAGLDRLIAKKRDLKQTALQQLLTGQTRLPGFHGEWEVKTLGDLFNFSGGYSASRSQLSTEGHCYLHYGDIHGATKTCVDARADYQNIPKFNIPLKRVSPGSLLKDGDVVFVDASEDDEGTSKHVVVVNKDSVPFISGLHTIVAKSKTNELVHEYRRYCFQTAAVRQQFLFYAVGKKVSGISKTNIPKLTLLVPSVPEQTVIADVLSDMDAELAALEARRDKTRDLKQAMMQELLTGKTRLVAV